MGVSIGLFDKKSDRIVFDSIQISHHHSRVAVLIGVYDCIWVKKRKFKKGKHLVPKLVKGLTKLREPHTLAEMDRITKAACPDCVIEDLLFFMDQVICACGEFPNAKIICSL